jgi:hypothetical protein
MTGDTDITRRAQPATSDDLEERLAAITERMRYLPKDQQDLVECTMDRVLDALYFWEILSQNDESAENCCAPTTMRFT